MAAAMDFAQVLQRLEALYGPVASSAPADPYEMLLWLNCGYPASDEACAKGFAVLKEAVGLDPSAILDADAAALGALLRAGGIIPEVRAQRLKEIARVARDEFGGDLGAALGGPVAEAKRLLKRFPTIGDPAAERILLFAGRADEPAAPAGGLHVLVRLGLVADNKDYAMLYRSVHAALGTGAPAGLAARQRAYLLLKRHGQRTCRRSRPLCKSCPLSDGCGYFRREAGAGV